MLAFCGSIASAAPLATDSTAVFRLQAIWNGSGQENGQQPLHTWTLQDLSQLRQISSREKDPVTGRVSSWQGVLLSNLVEKSLEGLPPERRAQVDLVVLRSRTGAEALVPRALITKYPILLATQKDHQKLASPRDSRGPLYSVVPWSSNSRILSEDVPLESYFLPQVAKIELTSYHERYSSLFLRRRTDPVAMRGEKVFIQNCIGCHSIGRGTSIYELSAAAKTRGFEASGHPELKGAPRLSARDHRSLVTYLDAFRGENGILDPTNPLDHSNFANPAARAPVRAEASTHMSVQPHP